MADDRLRNIREGAGKEDNRYSELMTDLLSKVGPYILAIVLIGSTGYLAFKWYDTRKKSALAAAFFELEQAIDSGSPASLEAVARDHAGQGAVSCLAYTELGEIHLTAARRGLAPGATLNVQDGTPDRPEDVLTTEQIGQHLTKASAAFQLAYDATKGDPGQTLHTLKALFGLAATAESKGDVEAAGRYYAEAADRAKSGGFDGLAQLATKRKETAGGLSAVAPLFATAELPPRIEPASPFPTTPTGLTPPGTVGASPINVTSPGGTSPVMTRMSGPPPGYGADGKPLPVDNTVGPPVPVAPPAPATPPAGEQPKSDAPANPPATPPAPPAATPPAEPTQDPKR